MGTETPFAVLAARGVAELIEETLTGLVPTLPAAKLTPLVCFLLALGFAFLVADKGAPLALTVEAGVVDGLIASGLWGLGVLVTRGKPSGSPPLVPLKD